MGFFDHLEELRWHIVRSVIAIAVFAIALFIYRQEIIGGVFMAPFKYDFVTYRIICENFTDAFCPPAQSTKAGYVAEIADSLMLKGMMYTEVDSTLPDSLRQPSKGVPITLKLEKEAFLKQAGGAGLTVHEENGEMVKIQATSPYEQFLKSMVYAFFGGLILAFPYVIWELWRFIRPALSEKEVRGVRGNVLIISSLFFTGVVFCYYILLPISIQFLASFVLIEEAENIWRIGDVISFEMMLLFGTGVMFQLPMVVYYLSKMGIMTPQWLRKYRRHSIVVLLIVAGIVTPPDPFSQILVFVPMMLLYEAGIVISARVQKRREMEEKALKPT